MTHTTYLQQESLNPLSVSYLSQNISQDKEDNLQLIQRTHGDKKHSRCHNIILSKLNFCFFDLNYHVV